MDHCNEFPTTTRVEAPLGAIKNVAEYKRYCTNSYPYVIGMMSYISSNKIPDLYFAVHQCSWFKHITKASQDTELKSICWYIQVTKDKCLVFKPSKKWCCVDTWIHILQGYWDRIIINIPYMIIV